MKAFYSAEQLAQLPGWPTAAKNCRLKAQRMGLTSRPRTGRGGGCEWLISGGMPYLKPHFKLHLDGRLTLLVAGGLR